VHIVVKETPDNANFVAAGGFLQDAGDSWLVGMLAKVYFDYVQYWIVDERRIASDC
jgi:hypothetical protein